MRISFLLILLLFACSRNKSTTFDRLEQSMPVENVIIKENNSNDNYFAFYYHAKLDSCKGNRLSHKITYALLDRNGDAIWVDASPFTQEFVNQNNITPGNIYENTKGEYLLPFSIFNKQLANERYYLLRIVDKKGKILKEERIDDYAGLMEPFGEGNDGSFLIRGSLWEDYEKDSLYFVEFSSKKATVIHSIPTQNASSFLGTSWGFQRKDGKIVLFSEYAEHLESYDAVRTAALEVIDLEKDQIVKKFDYEQEKRYSRPYELNDSLMAVTVQSELLKENLYRDSLWIISTYTGEILRKIAYEAQLEKNIDVFQLPNGNLAVYRRGNLVEEKRTQLILLNAEGELIADYFPDKANSEKRGHYYIPRFSSNTSFQSIRYSYDDCGGSSVEFDEETLR